MSFDKKKIAEIVDNNYVNASVLYYFGISFFDYSEETLEQACKEKGLKVDTVIKKLESHTDSNMQSVDTLQQYPIDLIVEYLKHAHYIFIKQRLPYLAKLIDGLETPDSNLESITKDLKFVFPLFVEDFIHHIYEEEDTLFKYIIDLDLYLKHSANPTAVYWQMEKSSLQKFVMEHEQHDDEMRGIRNITSNYATNQNTPLHIKVIYAELKALESELKTHAHIENNILFPKALMLEKEAVLKLQSKIKLN